MRRTPSRSHEETLTRSIHAVQKAIESIKARKRQCHALGTREGQERVVQLGVEHRKLAAVMKMLQDELNRHRQGQQYWNEVTQ